MNGNFRSPWISETPESIFTKVENQYYVADIYPRTKLKFHSTTWVVWANSQFATYPVAVWWRHNKSKMADGRHTANRFSVAYQRCIVRLTRNLGWRSRITWRHRSRDQSSKLQKFKMADDRYFFAISQPWINQFRRNLVDYVDANVDLDNALERNIFTNPRWRTAAMLKIVYISAILSC